MRQQAPWTSEDVTAVQTIGNILGPVRVLSREENRMTDQILAPDSYTGEEGDGWAEATGANAPAATFPEVPSNPHNHTYTWSPKLPDNSMLVIRANTPDELVAAVEAMAPLAGRLKTAWQAVVGTPQAPMPPQGGVNYNPQMPPPNQPYAGQPAWQQAGAPQAPQQQWAPPAPQGASVPQGWYKLTVPFPQKASFDAVVAQYSFRKGDPTKGGQVSWQPAVKSWFCAPDIAQAFGQFNPIPA